MERGTWSTTKVKQCNKKRGKSEEQLPQKPAGRLLAKLSANSWPTAAVGRQSAKNLSDDCWPTVGRLSFTAFYKNLLPTVGQLLAVCRPTVGSMSVICWPSVGWEPLSNTRKASARREEHCISTRDETFSLKSAILFRFFRDQSPRNLLCLGFFRYQTPHNPIASSSQSRSKKFVYSGFLQLFFFALLHRTRLVTT